jgi:bifunctional aspartokinase / homoserine dehydrogenase 1
LKDLLVMKFGGTSMGSAERIRISASLIAERAQKGPVAVVVSAMSKVTDLLLDSMRRAEAGDESGLGHDVAALRERHIATCRDLLPAGRATPVLAEVERLVSEFERIARGIWMLGERPPRSVDEAVATGEKLSALMMAAYLESAGTPAVAVNAAEVVITDAVFGAASPLMDQTRARASERLRPLLEKGITPIVTGFNGATLDGRPTTLGRGGSDFSASILAAALDASELWIWTDVDGIMSADPRLVKNVKVLNEVTYAEAAELAYNGAKVLHPRTLAPLVDRKIPVWSKNSFNPAYPGTRIGPKINGPLGPRAVTSMANVALISLEPASAAMSGTRLMARTLAALSSCNAEVLTLTSSTYRQSFCFLIRLEELERVIEHLEEELAIELAHGYVRPIEVERNVGLLAIVGEGMRGTPGLAGRIFTAISRENINIIAIAQGSSELTIAVVVRKEGLEKAVRAVHAECGLGVSVSAPEEAKAASSERPLLEIV